MSIPETVTTKNILSNIQSAIESILWDYVEQNPTMAVTSFLIAAIAGTGFAWRHSWKLIKGQGIKMDQKNELSERLVAIQSQKMDQKIDQSHQEIANSRQEIANSRQEIANSRQEIAHLLRKMEINEQMNAIKWEKMDQIIIQLRSDNAVLMKFVHDKLNGVGMTGAINSNQQQRLENQLPADPTILGLNDLATEIKADSKGDQKRRLENISPPEPPILHSGLPFSLVIKLVDFKKMASFLIRKLPK